MLNYTENYQLPQWVESDRVLMDDFNSLNSKLDETLLDLEQRKSEFNLLKQETLSRQQTNWTVSFSGIDCSAWHFLLLDIVLVGSGSFYLRPNNSADCNYVGAWGSSTGGGLAQISTNICYNILLFPMQTRERIIASTSITPGITFGQCNSSGQISYQNLTSMQLYPVESSYYLSSGSKFTMWGI